MKYFAPISKQQLRELWEIDIPWRSSDFLIQAKKTGEPIKNGSAYTIQEIADLKYQYKIIPLKL